MSTRENIRLIIELLSLVASLDMVLSKKRVSKALTSLPGCTGWSGPLLFANPQRQVFLCQGPFNSSIYGNQ